MTITASSMASAPFSDRPRPREDFPLCLPYGRNPPRAAAKSRQAAQAAWSEGGAPATGGALLMRRDDVWGYGTDARVAAAGR
ncbi:hypothetical protein CHELA40_50757 [Chelatococcus asaccharovorans]|nr:hypothetical protein CHELA17_20723 [Chelatococcus asaccharovorans]CAH1694165.1 hypothetical protein CHELA40_50757 [Chelatococcus asaccharovorans]